VDFGDFGDFGDIRGSPKIITHFSTLGYRVLCNVILFKENMYHVTQMYV
jgi:hypothetical protein